MYGRYRAPIVLLLVVVEQAEHVVAGEFFPALEEVELDGKSQAGDLAT